MADLTPDLDAIRERITRAHIRKRINEAVERYKAKRAELGDINAVFELADGWAKRDDLTVADMADIVAGAIMRCAELDDEAKASRDAIDTYVGALGVELAEVTRLRPMEAALAAVRDYLVNNTNDDAMHDPYTAQVIRESVLDILGEPDGGV